MKLADLIEYFQLIYNMRGDTLKHEVSAWELWLADHRNRYLWNLTEDDHLTYLLQRGRHGEAVRYMSEAKGYGSFVVPWEWPIIVPGLTKYQL